ncbi:MAG TPA: hypothetical protein PKN52_01415, partial [Trueperaceae bacterium]|nr:hypothetical protein [Trueperaceae bacterium]
AQTILGEARASVKYREDNDYTLAGNAAGTSTFGVDDGLQVSLNGEVIYDDGGSLSGNRGPITFTAKKGDTLKFVVRDTYGHCSGLQTIYLVKGTLATVADPGFDLGCGRPSGDQGIVHTLEFTIPF